MKKRLLLLEDEANLAFALEFNLTQEGYHVDTVASAEEAARWLAQDYDLIVLDVMLPGLDGFEYCTELRRKGVLTPILFLTAKGSREDIVRGLEAGGDDYMTKPFALDELLARIAAMLRRQNWSRGRDEPQKFTIGEHEVDFATHIVTSPGGSTQLTALEMRLLRYFIEAPERVIPREELLTGVWKVSSRTHTRTVDNFLVRLRKVFEKDPALPRHFLTVRGVGYRFVAKPDVGTGASCDESSAPRDR